MGWYDEITNNFPYDLMQLESIKIKSAKTLPLQKMPSWQFCLLRTFSVNLCTVRVHAVW